MLGPEASHLLLIRTNLGYGTVLTAACARHGSSASHLVSIIAGNDARRANKCNNDSTGNNDV
jgi:arginine repressor